MKAEHYPTSADVDAWCDSLLARTDIATFTAEAEEFNFKGRPMPRHMDATFIRFHWNNPTTGGPDVHRDATPFWGVWQPAATSGPAPLLVHVPGYGVEMSVHPELVGMGFNVLHVNPQGYFTPAGYDESKKTPDGQWPVLPDTVTTLGEDGYVNWLGDVLIAVRWALTQKAVQPGRAGVFGTSQGGGTALLLGSILRDRGAKAVAADVPFLTDFPTMRTCKPAGAYYLCNEPLAKFEATAPEKLPAAWRALGFVDTLSHAHRLTMPVLLTAGSADDVCPPPTIRKLFDLLPGTRSYTELAGQTHRYTVPFMHLARAWMGLYV